MRPPIRCIAAQAALLALVAACSTVQYRDDVAARVDAIEPARLRSHVETLVAIGPRPVGDEAATRATVDWLTGELRALGYQVVLEPFTMARPARVYASLRPHDDPDAAAVERLVADSLGGMGDRVLRATSERLRAEGWIVDGYDLRPAAEPTPLAMVNVIATKTGAAPDAPVVELSAHYDTVAFSPGADDNASGVAVLLEVARVVAEAPTEAAIRFCFFGAEEPGLVGSRAHLERLQERGDRLLGLLNLDSVAFTRRGAGTQRSPEGVPWFLALPDEGDFLVVAGSWRSGPLGNVFEDAADAYAPTLEYASYNRLGAMFRDGRRSDHAHYWDAGIPAVFLTDTTEFRGPHYHTPSDLPETLDWAFLEQVARATAAFALHTARPGETGHVD